MLTDVLVPGNRWDLLAPYPVPRPEVSVVVTHYEQPAQLARAWAALCAQTLPPAEVVIIDDGSAEPPRPPGGGPRSRSSPSPTWASAPPPATRVPGPPAERSWCSSTPTPCPVPGSSRR